uniref:Ig-like domain-containing protein n=1 Tax=Oryzias melastigma TaxID=30732 RepID=A0A3B3DBI4_ORYME
LTGQIYICMCVSIYTHIVFSERFVVSVGESKSVRRGDTVLLPCWLTPHQNAEDLVIRWYHEDHVDTPVMIYIPGKANRFFMDGSYVGRVSFDKKDSTSGGLKTGDVTLKLTNVTVRDDGKYTIFWIKASSSSSNLLTETGSLPVLSAVSKEDHTVNVSCESEGWFPQPEVRWSEDPDKDRVTFVRDSSGLIRVHSWILVSASSEVSCSVGLPNTKSLTVRLLQQFFDLAMLLCLKFHIFFAIQFFENTYKGLI